MHKSVKLPKGPCRYMVYTWGPKGFPYTYFKAQVYPIHLHGPFGTKNTTKASLNSKRRDQDAGLGFRV